jgi:nucleotide-binding universal stress UspA family protein
VWHRMLFAIDQFESGQTALRFTSEVAAGIGAQVSVIHIRELSKWARVPPLETPAEAESLVQEAVLNLQLAGVNADGLACSVPEDLVASRIFGEARSRKSDAIVVGSRRLHGIQRLSGHSVRDRILRLTSLPVVVAPTPPNNAVYKPLRFRSVAGWARAAAPRAAAGRRSTDWTQPQVPWDGEPHIG